MGKKRRRARSFLNTSSLFKYARIAAFVAPAAGTLMRKGVSMEDNIKHVVWQYTGYNIDHHYFDAGKLAEGWMPYIVTSLLTHGVQKLTGIIRRL